MRRQRLTEMATHELKIHSIYFEAVKAGTKTFELRRNDRNYQVGDQLILQEWEASTEQYSGDELYMEVTYILEGGFGLKKGYCVLSIKPMDEDAHRDDRLRTPK